MTPAEFIAEIVLPTMREFSANPLSRRHAYLACIVTFHVKDHLKKAGETHVEDQLRANEPVFFNVVRGVCNGAKHVSTNDNKQAAFTVGDDVERQAVGFGEGPFGVEQYADRGGRELATTEGQIDLYQACEWVLRSYLVHYPQHFTGCCLDGL